MTALNTPQYHHAVRENTLFWALLISILVHSLAVVLIPTIHFDAKPKPTELVIEIAQPKKVEPVPAPPPVATPEPPKPVIKPKIIPVAPKPVPTPTPVTTASPEVAPPVATPPVMAVAPKVEAPPASFTAPAPTPPASPPPEPVKAGPSQQDLDAARNLYGNLLAREIAKHKQYPNVARMRGWQGDVVLELQLDSNGNVLSSKIHDSSTYETLDKQALEMVKKASPFPLPPEALKGRTFTIQVPVSFHLE
jgi:periplasmic protein TonB